jgi:hypothetical protein
MLATPSATRQSPVGSAANAEPALAARINPEQATTRAIDLGQCNMVKPMLNGVAQAGSKRRIGRFQLTTWPSTDVSSEC